MGKKKKKINVLSVVSEVVPFIATGGMGQVAGALATSIAHTGSNIELSVVAPLYSAFRDKFEPQMTFLGETSVSLAWRKVYCGIFSLKQDGVTYYFVDNRDYFDRHNAYGYNDDGERFAFLSRSVFSLIEMTKVIPDIIHAHDWQTALVPIYLKTKYSELYPNTKSVFTIHNMEYQGKYPSYILGDVFDLSLADAGVVDYDGCINLMKGAIVCADRVTTVSPTYANEIKVAGGYGLEPIIRENAYKLSGIINGIDVDFYNPETDELLVKNYTVDSLENKAANKAALQKLFGLPKKQGKMLFCVVSRLVTHKGIDLITYLMEEFLKLDVQFLLLGTGDHEYELFFEELALRFPKQVGVNIAFNPEIAGKIYAGADVMLMPSQSEPCGLTQMISCRYGTIPIVRKTGGLGDTITDCRAGTGNGFVFEEYNADIFFDTIKNAYELYTNHKEDWLNLMKEAMNSDFSWAKSAREYVELYKSIMN